MAALNHMRHADLAIQSENLTEARVACSLAVQSAEQLVQLQPRLADSQLVLARCLLQQGTVQIQLALNQKEGGAILNRAGRLLQEMPRRASQARQKHEQLIEEVEQMLLIGQTAAAGLDDLDAMKLESTVRANLLKLHGLAAIRHGNLDLALRSAEALTGVDASDIKACFEGPVSMALCVPSVAASPGTPGAETMDLSEKCLAQVERILERCEQHEFFKDVDHLGQLLSRPELASFRKTRSEHPVIKRYLSCLTP
jgi:hypothetical protein